MNIVSRAEWGALPPKGPLSGWDSVLGSTVHWEGADINPAASDYATVVRQIQRYHQTHPTEHYSDIAYNFLVAPNGVVYEGRGWAYRSGANGTTRANTHYLAHCYLGGPNTPFTPAGQSSMDWLIGQTLSRYPLAADVKPHSYWFNTACPGDTIRAWIVHRNDLPTVAIPTPEEEEMGFLAKIHNSGGTIWWFHDGVRTGVPGPQATYDEAVKFLDFLGDIGNKDVGEVPKSYARLKAIVPLSKA